MFTFEGTVKDTKIKINCQKMFKNAIAALFQILNKASDEHDIFDKDFALCFGFSYFFLEKRDGFYQLVSLNYRKNPFNDRTDDLTIPLLVHNLQSEMVFTAKVQAQNTTFRQTMIVLKQAMQAKDIYLTRTEPTDDTDSGWYLGLTDDENEDNHPSEDFVKIPTCELLKLRPIAMRTLAMPVGTLVTISGDDITAVVDENDEPIPFTSEDELKKREQESNAQFMAQIEEARKKAQQEQKDK